MSDTIGNYSKYFFEVDLLIRVIFNQGTGFSHVLLERLSIVLTPMLSVRNVLLVSSITL